MELIDWSFSSHITTANSPSHVCPSFLTPVIHTTYFPSNWLLLHIDCKPTGERRMTLVTVTFAKPRKECWPSLDSNSQPLD